MKQILIQHDKNDLYKKNVIYQIECLITGDKYIGQTTCMMQRLKSHLGCHSNSDKSGCNRRTEMYNDAKLYGWENFSLSIIAENVTDEKIRREFEKDFQNNLEYHRYSSKDLNRNCRPKNKNPFIKITNVKTGEIYFFKTPKLALKYVEKYHNKSFHRSSLIKAQNNNYLLNRIWKVEGISESEYLKSL